LLVGLEGGDDAAVYRISEEIAVVQTVDFFPPVVDDPYVFGAVAAANAMSDVYAMGGEVLFALNIAGFPEDQPPEVLAEIFRGGADKVAEAGGVIAGGHTMYDQEPKYGLCVTGVVHPDEIISKVGARPGDALVLTKALGTGIILTGARVDMVAEEHLQAAVDCMLQLNRHPSHLAREAGVRAMTDVTGFALLGHAAEIAAHSAVRLVIEASRVPVLAGALEYAKQGLVPGGTSRNRHDLQDTVSLAEGVSFEMDDLLFDAQTSGGLLMAIPSERVEALVERLQADGFGGWLVGRVEEGAGVAVEA
jgi:selenide,water dikinase